MKRKSAMKSLAIVLSLAISAIVLPSGFTTASASKMNGKCCQSSDGGRSYRYRMAMKRAAMPYTCSAYAASCIRNSSAQPDRAHPMSILTRRELEFLTSLTGSWARLYRNELARLLHKVDDRCDAHHETRSIIRISAAPSSHSHRNSATTRT